LKRVPARCVDIVHEVDKLWVLKSLVAKELSDMSKVFLLDKTVVVFVVFPGPSEDYGLLAVLPAHEIDHLGINEL